MKYWLLTTEYPPFYGGGISTYCKYTAQMFSGRKHEVTVFVPDNSIKDYRIENEENTTIVRFNTNRIKLNSVLGYSARLSYEFADIVKTVIGLQGKPDYLEAQDYLGIAYYLLQFKRTGYDVFQDIPVIITLHSPAFLYLEYNRVATYKFPDFWTCEMEKQSIMAADYIISPTAFLPEACKHYIDLAQKRLAIIPNPYNSTEANNDLHFQRNKIIFYGKLSPQKGTFELLEYFKGIWDEGYNYSLELIGGTDIVYHPEQKTMGGIVGDKYKNYINKGLLKISEKITPDAITQKIQDAHVIIVPSMVDNLPYVVMEAMSRGKIVLASVQGGQREIIEQEVDGYLFDHKQEGDFKNQLFKVLALQDDEIIAVGKRAIEKIKNNYNFEVIYKQKIALLNLLSKSPSGTKSFPFLYQEEFAPLTEETDEILYVVIPYYNMGAYIDECVQSVLQSTYVPLEILIINDGSTEEKSIAKLKQLSTHKQITVYHKKNEGLAYTRNFGAKKAKGKYIAFLDADDKVQPDYYEKATKILKQYDNVFFVGAWTRYFGNSTTIWPTFTPQPPYALVHNPVNSSALIYKKAAFLAAGLNDKEVGYGLEDYESVIAMLHMGYNGVVLPELLFNYRVRTDSMIRAVNTNKLIYSNKYITEKHRLYYAKFAPQVINLLNANGPGYTFDNPTLEKENLLNRKIVRPLYNHIKDYLNTNPRLKNVALSALKKSGFIN